MSRSSTDPAAFRTDPNAASAAHPSRRQSIALLAVLVLVAGAIAIVSYAISPDRARSFQLLHGSVLIADQFGPVNVDLASGKGTLQIRGADLQAGVKAPGDLEVVPFDGGTLLLNRSTGEFNMVDSTGFVVKRDGGVTIPGQTGDTSATGIAAGQYSFIERTGTRGTDILLVSPSTVATAAGATDSVKPRASYTTSDLGSTAAGGSASANGELWTLLHGSRGVVVRQLSLPAESSAGATLRATDHGQTDTVSAIESATAAADGTGDDVVGVASPGRIRLFTPGEPAATVAFRAPAGTDTILPTSNAHGRLTFLLHATSGWSMVSVSAAGTALIGPVGLDTIDPDAQLAPPAASSGGVYTMLRSGPAGTVYRVAGNGTVTAAATYPQTMRNGRSIEGASFTDGYLIARGSRVVVDSPGHYLALTVFADASRSSRVIAKTDLTSVNAAAGAEALTRGLIDNNTTAPKPTNENKPRTQPAPVSNAKINCKQINQKPHIPQLTGVVPASRSVGLSWLYPVVAAQDCLPTTYVVSLSLVSNDAPQPPGSVVVQRQRDTVITGLYPQTIYEGRVTAYINRQATSSRTFRFTTTDEGPAAPTAITASADSSGNWKVAWRGCTITNSSGQRCVPAATWTIVPSYCDGRGVSASPAQVTVPADPTSVRQPTLTFKGAGLLGRGLQFRVQGKNADGLAGAPSAQSQCVYSYGQPDLSGMTLEASSPDNVALGGSSSTTVTLGLGADPIRDIGGLGSTVALILTGNGGTQTKTFTVNAPQSTVAATFDNLRAGAQYEATAVVTTAHGGLSQRKGTVQVTPRAAWPASTDQGGNLGVVATCAQGVLSCTLDLSFRGLGSAQVNGERFRLVQSSNPSTNSAVTCASGSKQLSADGFDPATEHVRVVLSQLELFYGTCQVRAVLVEESTGQPLYFGGVASPVLTVDVNLGAAQTAGGSSSDFSAAWDGSTATVTYVGGNALIGTLSTNWRETLYAPGGAACGDYSSGSAPVPGSAHRIPASAACLRQSASDAGWYVRVSYDNALGGGTNGPFTATIANAPFGRCSPTTFNAAWLNGNSQLQIAYTGDTSAIAGCPGQSWLFTVLDPAGNSCGQPSNGTSDPGATVTVTIQCATTPSPGWRVRLDYTDAVGNAQPTPIIVTANDPPG